MTWNVFPTCQQILEFLEGGGLSGLTWSSLSANGFVAPNSGSVINGTTQIVCSLPMVSAVGDEIMVVGYSANGWQIAQNSGQQIIFGTHPTTVGVSGSLTSTQPSDCVSLICVLANTVWTVVASQGNLNVA